MNSTEIEKLNQFAKNIGKNPLLVQGAGGNVSLKIADTLWIKASGKWLAQAGGENIFVAVDLARLQHDIALGVDAPVNTYLISQGDLRPSIETTLHALLPHPVVVHVHSVNVLRFAVDNKGKAMLNERLSGFNWRWIDYQQPGLALTQAIKTSLYNKPDILILANHGLVIGANDCRQAEELLNNIESKLQGTPRALQAADAAYLSKVRQKTGWIPPEIDTIHTLATDPISFKFAISGAMYPDHVVFLHARPPYLEEEDADAVSQFINEYKPDYILLKNKGVLTKPDLSLAAQEMLLCQALLLLRLDKNASVNYLSEDAIAQLQNWEAEKYRKKL